MLKRLLYLSDKGYKELKIAILSCVISGLMLFIPFGVIMQIMQTLIDPLATGAPLDTTRLWILTGAGLVAAMIYFIAYKYEYKKTYTVAYTESESTRIHVAEHMRKLPLSFFNQKDLSELTTNIMGDCSTIEHAMSHLVPQLIGNCILVVLISVSLAIYDWRMALALLCTLPLAFGMIFIAKKIENTFGEKHVRAKLEVSDQVQEYLEGIKVVKAFGMAGEKHQKLDNALRQMMKQAIYFEAATGIFVTLANMVLQVGIGIVILVGVNLLTGGSLGVVSFLTFLVVSVRIYAPFVSIMTMFPELNYNLIAGRRMQKLRSENPMDGSTQVDLPDYTIEFDHVTFAYNKEAVIKDMSFTVPPRAVTAFVGPSGSGKSTVSRLIARFWDVQQGAVKIGGVNIKDIDPETLMGYMSFVFQDVTLFNDTILNNIAIGKEGATKEEIIAAAKAARCHDFILEMPQGYDTIIGENGCTLSGGERQRLSIARALLKDAPIVLLDEATASLDPENEVLIQQAISELIQNRTVIVIAHRLRTIMNADQVIVLDEGQLVEQGKSADLIQTKGLFARLYHIQQESLGWSCG